MGPRLGKLNLSTMSSSGRDQVEKIPEEVDNQAEEKVVSMDEDSNSSSIEDKATCKEVTDAEQEERQEETAESKYKSVDLRPNEVRETGGSTSGGNGSSVAVASSSKGTSLSFISAAAAIASTSNNNIITSTPSASTGAVPKSNGVVEKSSKKRKGLKSSLTPVKRDFFGMRRSKKWPMMKLSSCCSKKEPEVEPLPTSKLACICTAYRRRVSEISDSVPVAASASISTPDQSSRQLRPIGGVVPIIDLSLFNPADYPIDDEDERMRRQRAKEMAEGVEVSLSTRLGVLTLNKHDSYHQVHTQVDYVHCLVPDLKEITSCSFYWGKIDRYEAEKLLEGKVEGTFLLRDSAQEEYLFSVSFRRYGRSLHARIEQWNYSFSFDSHDPSVFSSPTVTGLIEHYKDPSSCMFFEPLLTTPLHRNFPFDLQHLARSVICNQITYDDVNSLPLPKKLKVYCKEYHYKQRVRVRQLE